MLVLPISKPEILNLELTKNTSETISELVWIIGMVDQNNSPNV